MNIKYFIIIGICLGFLSGCITTGGTLGKSSPDKIAKQFRTEYNKYTKVTSVFGPEVECRNKENNMWGKPMFDYMDTVSISYHRQYEGVGVFFLNVNLTERHWCFAETIYDIDGRSFGDSSPNRSVISGDMVLEQLTFHLDREYMKSHIDSGIEFSVVKCGVEGYIPPNYIKAMLSYVDSL